MDALDIEECRTLLLLKAHYPVDGSQVAEVFRATFPNLSSDYAGRPKALQEHILANFDNVVNLRLHIMTRALYDRNDEETAWNKDLKEDFDRVMVEMGIEPFERVRDQPYDVRAMPPCAHQYTTYDNQDREMRKMQMLEVMHAGFAFDHIETAALVQGIAHDVAPCTRPLCDGYVRYVEELHQRAQSGWPGSRNDLQVDGETKQRFEKAFERMARRLGLSVTRRSIEPSQPPETLVQVQVSVLDEAPAWASMSPYREWEEVGWAAEASDRERIRKGRKILGKMPRDYSAVEDLNEENKQGDAGSLRSPASEASSDNIIVTNRRSSWSLIVRLKTGRARAKKHNDDEEQSKDEGISDTLVQKGKPKGKVKNKQANAKHAGKMGLGIRSRLESPTGFHADKPKRGKKRKAAEDDDDFFSGVRTDTEDMVVKVTRSKKAKQ